MNYLSEYVPVYKSLMDGWNDETYQHNEVQYDEYSSAFYALGGHDSPRVHWWKDRPADWFSVAVYTSERMYGGPEEGGWYYDAGNLVEHHRIKFFDKYEEAQEYARELWDWCEEENKDMGEMRFVVRCTTEAMPDTYYPKHRPYYS